VHQAGFCLHDYIETHGQQNIKTSVYVYYNLLLIALGPVSSV